MPRLMMLSCAALVTVFLASPAGADTAPADILQKDRALLTATQADLQKQGLAGIAPHLADLEQALVDGKQCFPAFAAADGSTIVLTDGPAETLVGIAMVSQTEKTKQPQTNIRALANPYPA